MKNVLDYDQHFTYLEGQNFIQCFASSFMYLERKANPTGSINDPEIGGQCFGCGSGGELSHCKKDKDAAKRCGFFFLFNTLTGTSAVRRQFDGKPTDMQKLTGYVGFIGDEGNDCGTDFVVDFLFGYTGYDYKKVTNAAAFKDEIITSIDAGKPMIAKLKVKDPPFHVIIGYDDDKLVVPHTINYNWQEKPPTLKPEYIPAYDEIDALYIFGDKAKRRYTLKDGLNNIRRVMEYNINAGLWDEYLAKIGELDKVGPDERQYRAKQLADTNIYMYNFCSFGGIFSCEQLPDHYLHNEFFDPKLADLWKQVTDDSHWAIVDSGHVTGKLNREQIWLMDDDAKVAALGKEVCEKLAIAQKADMEVLDLIKQAIAVLDK